MERFFFFQCSVPPWKALSDLAGRQSHMRVKVVGGGVDETGFTDEIFTAEEVHS